MPRCAPILLAVFVICAIPRSSSAAYLYTIDIVADDILIVDTATGNTTLVAHEIAPFARARCTVAGGVLYEVNGLVGCLFPGPPFMNTIDLGTLATNQLISITTGDADVPYGVVGDLTTGDGTLLMSLSGTGVDCINRADVLADLSPSADLTNLTSFAAFDADMNGLARSADGTIFALDMRSAEGAADLYLVARPSTYQLLGSYVPAAGSVCAGMTFASDGSLWALELTSTSSVLRRLDPSNGQLLETVPLSLGPNAAGLATADGPVPTRGASWGELKTLYR